MQANPGAARAQLFPALAERDVRLYALGQVLSVIGGWTQIVTINLLAWRLTASPAVLGLLNFLLFAPSLFVAPLAGSRITQANARRVTTWILSGSLTLSLLLTLLAALGQLGIGWLVGLAAVAGFFNAAEMPARQVLLVGCVRDAALIMNAVSINSLAWNTGRMVGPALGALLFSGLGVAWGFGTNVVGLALMLGCVQVVRASPAAESEPRGRGGLRDAIGYVRADRQARLMLPTLAALGVFAGGYQTLVPVLADRGHGDTAAFTGLFFGAAGAGSLFVALLLSSRFARQATRHALLSMPWITVLALCGVAVFDAPVPAAAAFALLGASITFTGPGTNATLQQQAPVRLRGALSGLFTMSFMGTIPFGQLLAGALAQSIGVRATLFALAGALALALLALFAPVWLHDGRITLDAERL